MATTINERIKAILDSYYHGNITAMAKATSIKRTTLNSIIGADGVSPRYEALRNIADLSSPKLSMEWLMRGVGEMELRDTKNGEVKNSNNSNTIISDGDAARLLALLEEKDKQITMLINKLK